MQHGGHSIAGCVQYVKRYQHVLFVVVFAGLWALGHLGSITYGAQQTPLYMSYVGDEQAPVYGALFMLRDMNPLGLRNETSVYYGPILSVVALPAIAGDLVAEAVWHGIRSPAEYRDFLLWDWGGVIVLLRVIAALISFAGLIAMFTLFHTRTLNPSGAPWLPWLATGLLATNYLYFSYGALFKHWVVVVTVLLWQLYCALRIYEAEGRKRYWIASVILGIISFGVSYLPIMYQVMWIPLLAVWILKKDVARLKEFAWFGALYGAGCALVVFWHPYAFIRMLGMVGIGEPLDDLGAILDVTSVGGVTNSLVPYALVILSSMHALVVAFAYVIYRLPRLWWREQLWVPVIVLPALTHYLVFSIPTQHVSRYMLPTVALLLVFGVGLFAHLHARGGLRMWGYKLIVVTGIVASLVNGYYLIGRERMMLAGPPDKRVVASILAWQQEDPGTEVLVVQHGPLGHPHTYEAYHRFLTPVEREATTWTQLLESEPPNGVELLDVTYLRERSQYTQECANEFDHVVVYEQAPLSAGTMDTHTDIFDFMPWKTWEYERYQDKYMVPK